MMLRFGTFPKRRGIGASGESVSAMHAARWEDTYDEYEKKAWEPPAASMSDSLCFGSTAQHGLLHIRPASGGHSPSGAVATVSSEPLGGVSSCCCTHDARDHPECQGLLAFPTRLFAEFPLLQHSGSDNSCTTCL